MAPYPLRHPSSYDAKKILIDAEFDRIPVEKPAGINAPDLVGSAAGRIRVEGEPARSSATMDLHVTDIRSKSFTKDIRFSRVDVEARAAGGSEKLVAKIQSTAEEPFRQILHCRSPFSGKLLQMVTLRTCLKLRCTRADYLDDFSSSVFRGQDARLR